MDTNELKKKLRAKIYNKKLKRSSKKNTDYKQLLEKADGADIKKILSNINLCTKKQKKKIKKIIKENS